MDDISKLIDYGQRYLIKNYGYSDDNNYIIGMSINRYSRLKDPNKGSCKNYFITCIRSFVMDVRRENYRKNPFQYFDINMNLLKHEQNINIFDVVNNIDNKYDKNIILSYINECGHKGASKKLCMNLKQYRKKFNEAISRIKEESTCLIS